MSETEEAGLKRMTMRSWRRGMKEMDLILGPFADETLAQLSAADLVIYDRLLGENDQEIYTWIMGTQPTPAPYLDLLTRINAFARVRHTPDCS
ncbi:succinate dehydrogenase assembly factor 2 [Phaeovulum sp.]|uniref:succinate dehydrogenase assembly factor 2 n=1 Tax=Phaeovulum sp. TaxID=2934796 RepID=UPI0039E49E5E